MIRLLLSTLLVAIAFTFAVAQQPMSTQQTGDAPNMGRAPREPNGIGRLDLRVTDQNGAPVKDAYAHLESTRTDGFFCESWGSTNDKGVLPMLPIHMGSLKLIVKAKGYKTLTISVPTASLADPVRVSLVKK